MVFEVGRVTILAGDFVLQALKSKLDYDRDTYMYKTFYIADPSIGGSQICAAWTPKDDIVIERIDAYAITAESGGPGEYVRYTLTDGTSPIYAEIANGAQQGNWTGTQKFAATVELQLQVVGTAGANQALATVVIQYRKY
jgi:hypothetical protein